MASVRLSRAIPASLLAAFAAACDPGYHLVHGLLSPDGEWTAEPRFEALHPLSESLSAAVLDGRWGFIDVRGEWVIEPVFDGALDFSEGVAAVSSDGRWHYVDRRGRTVIAGPFLGAGPFEDGLAPVQTGTGWGFVDHAGDFLIEPHFQALMTDSSGDLAELPVPPPCFSEGLCAAKVDAGWGYIDRSGSWVIPPVLESAGWFAEGLAAAGRATTEDEVLVGFVDRSGAWAIEPRFEAATRFASGRAIALVSHSPASNNGDSLLDDTDMPAANTPEGGTTQDDGEREPAAVSRVVMIDTTGREVVDLGWEMLGEVLDETVALVELLYRNDFEGGMLPASRGRAWGFVDRNGAWVIEPRFGLVLPFRNGVAAAAAPAPADDDTTATWLEGRWGLIDRAGRWIVEPGLEAVGRYGDSHVMARRFGRWGVLDADGRWVTPPTLAELARFLDFDLPGIGRPGEEGSFVGAVFANHRWVEVDRRGRTRDAGSFEWLEGLAGRPPGWQDVHLVRDQSAWGLVDRRGVPLTLPPLDTRPEPSGPYLKAVTEGRWGCLDSRARWVVPARFDSLDSCGPGPVVASVSDGTGLWDSPRGWIVQPGEFDSVLELWPGVYGLQSQDGWGLHRLDRKAGRLQPIEGGPYQEPQALVGGLAVVARAGRLALIGATHPVAEQFPYDDVEPVYMADRKGGQEWLVRVRVGETWGVVDASGERRIPVQFDRIGEAYDGMVEVERDGRRGLMDLDGAWLLPARFDDLVPFNRKVVAFRRGDRWGLARGGDGDEILSPALVRVQRDGEHLAIWAARESGPDAADEVILEGRIDGRGRILVEPRYESIREFGPRYWVAGSDDGSVLLSKANGRPVRQLPRVVETGPLQQERAATKFRVDELGKTAFGYLDDRGRVAIEPVFDEAGAFESGLAVVSRQGRCGVIGRDGRVLLPVESDHCNRLSDGRIVAGVEEAFDADRWTRALEAARERADGERTDVLD
jgi:hypothetical protein